MNLLVGDLRFHSVAYLTNRGRDDSLKAPRALEPGVYGISNGVLGDPWVKVRPALHCWVHAWVPSAEAAAMALAKHAVSEATPCQ